MSGRAGATVPDLPTGLTAAEVQARVADGRVNRAGDTTSRTWREIVKANVFTRFNAVLGSLFVVILVVGPLRDALFGIVLVANTLIGIIQELRAKNTLDRLAVLSAPKVSVVRDGSVSEIAVEEVVADDVVELTRGEPVVADGEVIAAEGLEVDESLLSGESVPVARTAGEPVLSGSFVVAGSGYYRAEKVGVEAYAYQLAEHARRFELVRSELRTSIDRLLVLITWVMAPTSVALLASQLSTHEDIREALVGTVAGVVAMVPEGLVLLTSMAFAISVLRLGRRNVLVRELPAVEGLARVDVFCIDKTGTLTDGSIAFDALEILKGAEDELRRVLAELAGESTPNPTLRAIRDEFGAEPQWTVTEHAPFSSERKWSGAAFEGQGTWLLGAPEILIGDAASPVLERVAELAAQGARVILLASSSDALHPPELPGDIEPRALVVLSERIRPDAADTLRYLDDQGVRVIVISGDNPTTVGAVAAEVGVRDDGGAVDGRDLPEDLDELGELLDERRVYGRVTPQQKRSMVLALQQRGHVVAMTGDGVNDIPALKDADIGVAMGSGAAATRSVARLVLLDGQFSSVPSVINEGRRVLANVERVSSLFVTKTVYAMLLAVAVGLARWPFPFLPRHLTLIGGLTIGIPGFFLAFAPTAPRYRPGILQRVLRFAVPAGAVAATATFVAYAWVRAVDEPVDEARTAATFVLASIGFWVLVAVARPFTWPRRILISLLVIVFAVALGLPSVRDLLALPAPPSNDAQRAAVVAGAALIVLEVAWRYGRRRATRDP